MGLARHVVPPVTDSLLFAEDCSCSAEEAMAGLGYLGDTGANVPNLTASLLVGVHSSDLLVLTREAGLGNLNVDGVIDSGNSFLGRTTSARSRARLELLLEELLLGLFLLLLAAGLLASSEKERFSPYGFRAAVRRLLCRTGGRLGRLNHKVDVGRLRDETIEGVRRRSGRSWPHELLRRRDGSTGFE